MVCACHKVNAQVQTATLEEIYLHCPESAEVVFKEIQGNFGMKLSLKDCDLNLLNDDDSEGEEELDIVNESPARARRIKRRRQTRIANGLEE